jgi:sugar/nucleoside kinase (ribokinase family)
MSRGQPGPTPCKVVLLGDLMIDVICRPSEEPILDEEVEGDIAVEPGGQAFVVAAWLVRQGCRAVAIGALSGSPSGRLIKTLAEGYGVTIAGPTVPKLQGTVVLISRADGTSSKITHVGAASMLTDEAIRPDLLDGCAAVYISGYVFGRPEPSVAAALALCRLAHARSIAVYIDVAARVVARTAGAARYEALLAECRPTVLFGTEAEYATVLADASEARRLAPIIVIKRGRRGATLIEAASSSDHPAPLVEVADASGAGDALAAAFIAEHLTGASPRQALRRGLDVAAACIARVGPLPEPLGRPLGV